MNRTLATLFFLFAATASGIAAEKANVNRFDSPLQQAASEATLASVRRSDASARDAKGAISKLTPAEHMRRANVYNSNRAFAEARVHWQALITY